MDQVLGLLLALGILLAAGLVTQLFARAMYLRCPQCGTLNARRRRQCRECGQRIRQ